MVKLALFLRIKEIFGKKNALDTFKARYLSMLTIDAEEVRKAAKRSTYHLNEFNLPCSLHVLLPRVTVT